MQAKYIQSPLFPNLHYRVMGHGPAIVLLHGFPETGKLWSKVWDELAMDFTLIIPDMPGSGESSRCTESLTMELMADAVAWIMDVEHINDAIIAGHSMGGYVAMAFAEKYPLRLKGLVMVHSIASADPEEKKEQRRKSISLILKGGKQAFVRQMIPNLFSKTYKKNNFDELRLHTEDALQQSAESLADFYNAMIMRPDRVKVLADAVFPVLWLIGREDAIATSAKVLQQSTLANVNFVSVYDDCAHMGMIEQPVKLQQDIAAFAGYCNR